VDYEVVLGNPVSLWTTHVSSVSKAPESLTLPNPSLFTSIFPERDSSCNFIVHNPSDRKNLYKVPPGYNGNHIPDLVTLKQYTEGGNEIPNAKILVCVKSISASKKGQRFHNALSSKDLPFLTNRYASHYEERLYRLQH
jgi:hypothetical protein